MRPGSRAQPPLGGRRLDVGGGTYRVPGEGAGRAPETAADLQLGRVRAFQLQLQLVRD